MVLTAKMPSTWSTVSANANSLERVSVGLTLFVNANLRGAPKKRFLTGWVLLQAFAIVFVTSSLSIIPSMSMN